MSDFWVKEAVSILRQNGSRECAEAVGALAAKLAKAEALRKDRDTARGVAGRLEKRLAEAEAAIEAAGRCLVMSNSGAAEALKILRGFKQADSASGCQHDHCSPWKLSDGRAGWKCDDCGVEFRLTADQPEPVAR